jgi:hypothetical protein
MGAYRGSREEGETGVEPGLTPAAKPEKAASVHHRGESEMNDLYMYSRQDSLTPTGYTALEPRRRISETSPEATLPPEPIYRCMAPRPNGFILRGELERLIDALRAGAVSEARPSPL